jgi:membrane associated rhomboid family serine protease
MGISDRDYSRVRPDRPDGWMGLRRLSFNSWLIVINVVVYLVSNQLLSDGGMLKQAFFGQKQVDVRVDYGMLKINDPSITTEDLKNGSIDKTVRFPIPTLPGDAYGRQIYRKPQADQSAPPVVIGYQREGYLPPLYAYGHFSTAKAFGGEFWRFFTFQFLHANFTHLIFNMFGLWFVGGLVEQYLGSRRYAVFYLLSGACGGLMYLFLNLLGTVFGLRLPGVLFNDVYTPLIGASAGVFAVLMAAAYIQPKAIVQVYFLIPMKLRTAVYGLMAITLINLLRGAQNAGGEAAHVGGALSGFYLIRRPHILRTIFGLFGSRDVPLSRRDAFSGVNSSWGSARAAARSDRDESSGVDWSVVDRVVNKAKREGLESLTPGEKRLLAKVRESLDGA